MYTLAVEAVAHQYHVGTTNNMQRLDSKYAGSLSLSVSLTQTDTHLSPSLLPVQQGPLGNELIVHGQGKHHAARYLQAGRVKHAAAGQEGLNAMW